VCVPEWFSGLSNRCFFKRRSYRTAKRKRATTLSPTLAQSPCAHALEDRQLLSTSWFVSPSGSNQNPGTLEAPLQTIQAAANVAQPGDYVEIETGIYRETVVPAHSGTAGAPITYEAFNNESVTVNGANLLTGWTNTTGDIYQTAMPVDLGEGNNQLFLDGKAVSEASWPTQTGDASHPTTETAPKITLGRNSATIYDPNLSQPAGFWDGAIIHIEPGQGWVAQTGTVTSSAPGQLTFSYYFDNKYEVPKSGNQFYLTGTANALDAPGEWYRNPKTGQVSLWAPASDDPNTHFVETKARQYAFNVSQTADITISGVNIFGAGIESAQHSYHTIINGMNAAYVSQYLQLTSGWRVPSTTGIVLYGADSLLENSSIAYSAGDGVYVSINAYGTRITNCVIHDVDTDGGDNAAIRDYAAKSEIDHNTIYNTGRDGILHQAAGVQILYNSIHNFGLQTTDAGGIYTVKSNGGGTVIAYNDVYDGISGGYGESALYCDDSSSNYIIHDNPTWNVNTAVKFNGTSYGENVYNNSLGATKFSVDGNFLGGWGGTKFANNIFLATAGFGSGASSKNNATSAGATGVGPAGFSSGAPDGVVTKSEQKVGGPPPPVIAPPPASSPLPDPTSSDPSGATEDPSSPVPLTAASITADRNAITTDTKQRAVTLVQLAKNIRTDLSTYHAADRQLVAARRDTRRSPSSTTFAGDLSTLATQIQQLQATIQSDKLALRSAQHSDFTGIHAAHLKLAADLKALRVSHRKPAK
jgi:hypothetical protein